MEKFKKIIISVLIISFISLITVFFLFKFYQIVDKVKINKKPNITGPVLSNTHARGDADSATNIKRLVLDSLNEQFIQEVSGSGRSGRSGYGTRAKQIKGRIDSLKADLDFSK